MAEPKAKILVKDMHLHAGLDLIGAKTSMNHRVAEMEATPLGIMVVSKKTKRRILVPWTNIKGCELFDEDGTTGKKRGLPSEAIIGEIPAKNH